MALARMVPPVVLLVALAGFSPVSGCARGCSGACRGTSKFTRSGANSMDDLARNLPRTPPPRYGVRPLAVPGQVGGELGPRATMAGLDDAVAALPPAQGSVSSLAKLPASNGKVMVARPGARSFADDYARSIDAAGVTRQQHQHLLDAFDAAQTLVEAAASHAEPSDDPIVRELTERARIAVLARELDGRMRQVLDDAQLQQLHAALGTPRVIAYRLARERPLQRPAPSTSGDPAGP